MSENNKNDNKQNKKKRSIWIFPASVFALYILLFLLDSSKTMSALTYATRLFVSIIPILAVVIIFMFLFNLIDEKKLKHFIDGSPRFIQYMAMLLLGTLSHGPIYAWYPLMKEFMDKGISNGSIAIFLYARGIKLSLLPMLIVYFGFEYAFVLTVVMLFFSCIQGFLVDILMKNPPQTS
ncbi:MAG TPA: hypothetical protein VJ990_06935 [Clostridia bacterium]|nr:hypothetical protein [Clostridia bacterium]